MKPTQGVVVVVGVALGEVLGVIVGVGVGVMREGDIGVGSVPPI